jgi:hypothetical protein
VPEKGCRVSEVAVVYIYTVSAWLLKANMFGFMLRLCLRLPFVSYVIIARENAEGLIIDRRCCLPNLESPILPISHSIPFPRR